MDVESRVPDDRRVAESSQSDVVPDAPGATPPPRRSRASNRWLISAVAATIVGGLLVTMALLGIQKMPWEGTELPAVDEGGPQAETLTVAVARTPGGPSEWTNWARIIKYVSEDVGFPVAVRYLTKEEQAAEVIASEDIDLAFVCPHHYVDLTERGVVEGICAPVIEGTATTTYMMLVRADDPATCLEDLEGSVVAASDKSSLGGYAYLSYLCRERGIEPSEFFSELRLGDTQDSDVRAVLNGSVRATVVTSSQMVGWDTSGLKAIEKSIPVGNPPLVASLTLDEEMRERIRDSLLAMDPTEVLATGTKIEGFVPVDPGLYDFAKVLRGACGHHAHE